MQSPFFGTTPKAQTPIVGFGLNQNSKYNLVDPCIQHVSTIRSIVNGLDQTNHIHSLYMNSLYEHCAFVCE